MLNCEVIGGGVGEGGGEGGEVGGGVGGGGNYGICCFINWTAFLGENQESSSSLSRDSEIMGLFSNSSLPL